MESDVAYYFVRANGISAHTNPRKPDCFVAREPTPPPGGCFNHVPYCLREGIVRIGWPDTGDLRRLPAKSGALAQCYEFGSLKSHVRAYLTSFRDIEVGSVVLMPDKDSPGRLYIGDVMSSYDFFHRPPEHPYENAHRVGVRWDRRRNGEWCTYEADALGIGVRGSFWTRAFHRLDVQRKRALVQRIEAARDRAREGMTT